MNSRARWLSLFVSVGLVVVGSGAARAATFNYTTDPYVGPAYTFDNVNETTNLGLDPGDPDNLFGNDTTNIPTVFGSVLDFDPLAAFQASGADGASDTTASQLKLEITANAVGTPIDTITITESGTLSINGTNAATGIYGSIGGTVTIHEVNGVPIVATLLPGGIPVDSVLLGAPDGTTTWSLTSVIDVASAFPGATKVSISLDNFLTAYTEGVGADASIAKTDVKIAVPEPTTFGLVVFGLLGAAAMGRRSRR